MVPLRLKAENDPPPAEEVEDIAESGPHGTVEIPGTETLIVRAARGWLHVGGCCEEVATKSDCIILFLPIF